MGTRRLCSDWKPNRIKTGSVVGSLLRLGLTTAVGLLLRAAITWWALPLGVLSHLLLDTLTWGGVPWLWPWKKHFRARWALHTLSLIHI